MRSRLFAACVGCALSCVGFGAGCAAAGDPSADDGSLGVADGELAGNPASLHIGMNGLTDQFSYFDAFLAASPANERRPRLCHMYPSWNVAEQPPGSGPANQPGSRAYLEKWLADAENHCDEALITFKAYGPAQGGVGSGEPTAAAFAKAFTAFRNTTWKGWTGSFSYSPWNEPNNPAQSGNGLSNHQISPEHAAEFYLKMRRRCAPPGCKVAAGDLASDGRMIDDFQENCTNDNGPTKDLCSAASYLDKYKNYIVNHATEADPGAPYKLSADFRPEYFGYHPWYDLNDYVNTENHCGDKKTCSTRALLESIGGSWGRAEIWNTEVGIGSDSNPISDARQACGAAFLIRLSTDLSNRITRVYYTHFHTGNAALFTGAAPRPALSVLARRERSYSFSGGKCF